MTPRINEEVPVLVAGAGPAGLVAAATLAKYGVETLVVDTRPAPSRIPRANAINMSAMELFRSWGLESEIREGDVDVVPQARLSKTLSDAAGGDSVEVGFPSREQSDVLGPAPAAAVAQDHLEPILERHVASSGVARVERETSVVDVEMGVNDVVVTLADARLGRQRRVRAKYLVGADGIRSSVRSALGIRSWSSGSLGERLAVLMRGPLWEVAGRDHRYTIYLTQQEREDFFLPVGKPDRWVYGASWDFDAEPLETISHDRARALIRAAAGRGDLEIEIERVQRVTYEVALAQRFREGRAFLVGDAAHRVTPRGGTGMNSAIRDGYDLAWKLAWVLKRWAGEELLDSYEAERRPVAEHNAKRSSDPTGTLRTAAEEVRTDLGGRIRHIWLAEGRSSLDLLGHGLTLLTGPNGEHWKASAGRLAGGPPLHVEALGPMASRALGVSDRGALLVRPDGVPVALWSGQRGQGESLAREIAFISGEAHGNARLHERHGTLPSTLRARSRA